MDGFRVGGHADYVIVLKKMFEERIGALRKQIDESPDQAAVLHQRMDEERRLYKERLAAAERSLF